MSIKTIAQPVPWTIGKTDNINARKSRVITLLTPIIGKHHLKLIIDLVHIAFDRSSTKWKRAVDIIRKLLKRGA